MPCLLSRRQNKNKEPRPGTENVIISYLDGEKDIFLESLQIEGRCGMGKLILEQFKNDLDLQALVSTLD